MKKIGVLTRHVFPNYGTILQAFSLQTALEQCGADVSVVDYVTRDDRARSLGSATMRASQFTGKGLKGIAYRTVQTPVLGAAALAFRWHQKRLLHLTRRVSDEHGLAAIASNLDAVVAGSDQVWNRVHDRVDPNFFLGFCGQETERLSYAASMGGARPAPGDQLSVLGLLRELDTVSLRETISRDWVQSEGIRARSDIDPTLLHDRDFWNDFAGTARPRSPYILAYQLQHTPSFGKHLRAIQRYHGMSVIRVTPDLKHIVRPGRPHVLVAPEHWVRLFRDASFVVTDSFHGTAFALRFGVPLYAIRPLKHSERITNLLRRVELDRLMVPEEVGDIREFSPYYDGDSVELALRALAEDSWAYVRTIAAGRSDK